MDTEQTTGDGSAVSSEAPQLKSDSDRVPRRGYSFRDLVQIAFFALIARPFLTLFIGLRVRGRENLPSTGQFILIANHSSHLDTVSILSLFSLKKLRTIRPVAAADYFQRNKFISVLSRTFFNILPIPRKKITAENNPVTRMREAISAGDSILIFPEGTRGSGDEMGPFRSGIAHLIEKNPDIPVVPTYLVNMGRSLPKGEFIPVPFFCEIRIGRPRLITGTRAEVVARLEASVRELK